MTDRTVTAIVLALLVGGAAMPLVPTDAMPFVAGVIVLVLFACFAVVVWAGLAAMRRP